MLHGTEREARSPIAFPAAVFLKILAGVFRFDEPDGTPEVMAERRAAAVFMGLADAKFSRAACSETTGLTESLEEPVEKTLRLIFSVAGDVFLSR